MVGAAPVPAGGRDLDAAKPCAPGDLYRIPAWLLLKALYTLAPPSLLFRLATLRGLLAAATRERRAVLATLERHLAAADRRELRRIARAHLVFRARSGFCELWPALRGFAGGSAVRVEGLEHLDRALAEGRGAILASAHFGHGRLIKPVLRVHGYPVLVVGFTGKGARDPRLALTRLGAFVHTRLLALPRASHVDERWQRAAGSDLAAGLNARPLVAALGENAVLTLLADGRLAQASSRLQVGGMDVDFTPGLVNLARDTGAAVLPAFVVDDPGRSGPAALRLVIHSPLELQATGDRAADAEANLRRLARAWEEQLRTHPHDWRWEWMQDGVLGRPRRAPAGGAA